MKKPGLLQEKFQRTMPKESPQEHQWTTFESQRKKASQDMQSYSVPPNAKRTAIGGAGADFSAPRTNRMPPGMNIGNQKQSEQNRQPYSNAGATDESNSVNASMLKNGYQRQNMKPEDEMYNDEHIELFYGTAEVDGDVGFCERNNYLDRT